MPSADITSADINGIAIHYTDSGGDGPAILFCHGFLMDHTMFEHQIADLSKDYRCISWDERGFGATPAPADFSYWDSAADAVGLLDHLGIDKAIFVGMSQGGYLSLRAALATPGRVRALALIDSSAAVDDAETIAGYKQMIAALEGGDEATVSAVLTTVAGLILGDEALSAKWVPIWKARLKTAKISITGRTLLERDDISARMSEIRCPVLMFHGSEDHAIEVSLAKQVADNVADCRDFIMVEGAAHAPNMTHPETVTPKLRAFVDSL